MHHFLASVSLFFSVGLQALSQLLLIIFLSTNPSSEGQFFILLFGFSAFFYFLTFGDELSLRFQQSSTRPLNSIIFFYLFRSLIIFIPACLGVLFFCSHHFFIFLLFYIGQTLTFSIYSFYREFLFSTGRILLYHNLICIAWAVSLISIFILPPVLLNTSYILFIWYLPHFLCAAFFAFLCHQPAPSLCFTNPFRIVNRNLFFGQSFALSIPLLEWALIAVLIPESMNQLSLYIRISLIPFIISSLMASQFAKHLTYAFSLSLRSAVIWFTCGMITLFFTYTLYYSSSFFPNSIQHWFADRTYILHFSAYIYLKCAFEITRLYILYHQRSISYATLLSIYFAAISILLFFVSPLISMALGYGIVILFMLFMIYYFPSQKGDLN